MWPLVGWCTWAGLKKADIFDLWLQKTKLKSVSFQENVPEMERSRRVDTPSIFCFCPTPKTRGAKYSATWENIGNFHPNPRFRQDFRWLLMGFCSSQVILWSFLVTRKMFCPICVFFFYGIFALGNLFVMLFCLQITSFIEFEYLFFSSWTFDFHFFP